MNSARRFSTFNGVFLPTILSILGVILFLRTGWVVGNSGLYNAVVILVVANIISLATGLSLSAIATNIEVGGGGVYYIISRSLGLDSGGAIGIPLYFSQSVSVAFYSIGFAESLTAILPHVNVSLVAMLIILIFAVISFFGANFAVKIQYIIFVSLIIGIISFLASPNFIPIKDNLTSHLGKGMDIWKVFAVFFPAVTGITAGVSMSGDLKNPGKSIPAGTLLAVIVSFFIYLLTFVKLSAIAPHNVLLKNTMITVHAASIPFLVLLGIWAASLSSALTFIVGAPRTLQALAKDGVVPSFLSNNLGSVTNEPRVGVIITFIIAELFAQSGNLNRVASIITMFFLLTYGVTNFAAGAENIVKNPSYRPRFHVHWIISFIGMLGSLTVMFLISKLTTFISIAVVIMIYLYLSRKKLHQTWGDVRTGIWMSLARFSLLKLEDFRIDPVNWRPNVMVFTGNPATRLYLSRFAEWLGMGNGIVTLFNVIEGKIDNLADKREDMLSSLKEFIKSNNIPAFSEVEVVPNFQQGVKTIVQAHGIGQLYSNIALFGFGHEPNKENKLVALLRELVILRKDVLILKYDNTRGFGYKKTIDVWWGGKGGNAALMLLIAHILTLNDEWEDASVRILKVVNNKNRVKTAQTNIQKLLDRNRINAKAVVLVKDNPENTIVDTLSEFSITTDLVIIGTGIPKKGQEPIFTDRIVKLISPLGTVLLVRSTENKEEFLD